MEDAKRRSSTLVLALILLLGAFLRFYRIDSKTLWLDEAFSVWIAHHALTESWSWLIRIDQHPPLYYSLLHFWQGLFGDSQGVVRAFSALCSTLALPFFYAACRRWFTERTALLATLILALSPFHIRYAQETRMYALLSLGVTTALYFLTCLLLDKPAHHRWRNWIGLAVAQTAVMLTHNTATVFFPLALNLGIGGAWLWTRRKGSASSWPTLKEPKFGWRWLGAQALALLLWSAWLVPFITQSIKVDKEFWIGPPTLGMIFDVLRSFNFAFLPGQLPFSQVWDVLYWGLAGLGVYALRRTPARAFLLLALCLTPFLGELLVSLRRPIFYERTLIWASLSYYMLLAVGIEWVGHNMKAEFPTLFQNKPSLHWPNLTRLPLYIQNGVIVAMVALSLLALSNYYFYFQKEEWDKAAAFVAQQVKPGDMILFNATWIQIPFEYYFRHYATDAELHGLPVDLFDRGVLEPKMAEADVPYMHKLLAGQSQVWLVYSHDWYTDPNKIIPRELGQMLPKQQSYQFVGLQVIHYAVK
ncbi:MAG: glycosyltransferase family 39 protein [Caldilineaceae bacterium]